MQAKDPPHAPKQSLPQIKKSPNYPTAQDTRNDLLAGFSSVSLCMQFLIYQEKISLCDSLKPGKVEKSNSETCSNIQNSTFNIQYVTRRKEAKG